MRRTVRRCGWWNAVEALTHEDHFFPILTKAAFDLSRQTGAAAPAVSSRRRTQSAGKQTFQSLLLRRAFRRTV